MPLFRQCAPTPESLAAIWQIDEHTENELFFSLPLIPQIDLPRLPRRRLEFLAGRYLLWHLKNDFPIHQILKDIHGKPRLPEDAFHFSISHSFPYIAVIISPHQRCGIDIQCWHPRMQILADKFLSPEEKELFQNDSKLLTLAWSIKEAVYKWNGRRGVDFIRDINIQDIKENSESYTASIHLNSPIAITPLKATGFLEKDFSLALVCE